MTGLERIRRRVPLVVFVLLLVLIAMTAGVACACLAGDSMQQADRSAPPLVSMPALVEMWSPLALVAALIALVVVARTQPTGRASPAVTQRFLF